VFVGILTLEEDLDMSKHLQIVTGGVLFVLTAIQPLSLRAENMGPPAGWILDLNGRPITTTYTNYTITFTATFAKTDLRFELRNDPGWFGLDDISMLDNTTPSGQLVVNGGFEGGVDGLGNPTGWTFTPNPSANFASGVVQGPNCSGYPGLGPRTGSFMWCDASVGTYDTLDQNIVTTIGDSYTVSFWLASIFDIPVVTNFQQLSTNDANPNGADVLVYALAVPPPSPIPEPISVLLLGSGLAGIGLLGRRRAKKA
jgi:hypothetical protein